MQAVDKKNSIAMNSIGNYYAQLDDLENMLKYWKMSAELNN